MTLQKLLMISLIAVLLLVASACKKAPSSEMVVQAKHPVQAEDNGASSSSEMVVQAEQSAQAEQNFEKLERPVPPYDILEGTDGAECIRFHVAPSEAEFKICLFTKADENGLSRLTKTRLDDPSKKYDDILVEAWDDGPSFLHAEDLNFDGRLDLLVFYRNGYGPNEHYWAWLWDDSTQDFIQIPEFEEISIPRTKPEKKLIIGYARTSLNVYTTEVYRWIDGKLIMVESFVECRADEEEFAEEGCGMDGFEGMCGHMAYPRIASAKSYRRIGDKLVMVEFSIGCAEYEDEAEEEEE